MQTIRVPRLRAKVIHSVQFLYSGRDTHTLQLKDKWKEAFKNVLPITVIILILSFFVTPVPVDAMLAFLLGFICAAWLIVAKLVHQSNGIPFRQVTDQPLFYLALVAVILGTLFFLSGFLGEMISRNSQERNKYNIKDTL